MEGEDNSEFASWLKAQGGWDRRQLDASPCLAYWQTQLERVVHGGKFNGLQQPRGGRVFFLRVTADHEAVLMLQSPCMAQSANRESSDADILESTPQMPGPSPAQHP
jgi:hypothetical protein